MRKRTFSEAKLWLKEQNITVAQWARETGRHFTPMKYYEYRMKTDGMRVKTDVLSPLELDFMYRPEEERIPDRGVVSLHNNTYFHQGLLDYSGQKVRVAYDIHDTQGVLRVSIANADTLTIGIGADDTAATVAAAINAVPDLPVSARDGGMRIKTMPLPADKWDLIPLPQSVAISAGRLFHRTHGAGYDWLGAIGVVLKSPHSKSRWFCSEWCAYVIGYTNPCRYSPQTLYAAVSTKDRPSEKMEETK